MNRFAVALIILALTIAGCNSPSDPVADCPCDDSIEWSSGDTCDCITPDPPYEGSN